MIKTKENMKIVFAGDSITDGGRSRNMDLNHNMGHGYQYIVSSKIAADNIDKKPKFVNKGFSGGGINALYEVWYEQVLKLKPDVISIYIGVNDLYKSIKGLEELNVKRYENVYDLLLADTKAALPNVKLVLVEPIFGITKNVDKYVEFSPNVMCEKEFVPLSVNESDQEKEFHRNEVKRFQEVAKRLAEKYNAVFVPLQTEFDKYLNNGTETEYLLWDGVHPTVAGHGIIARQWYDIVDNSEIFG